MKNLKPHFVYNRKQRNGVFYLLLFLVVVQLLYFYIQKRVISDVEVDVETIAFIKHIDSLKLVKKNQIKYHPFNPNYISDEKGYAIGMSVAEIDRLLLYRAQNKWLTSSKDFQRITKVSDSLLTVLAPLFVFPKMKYQVKKRKDSFKISKSNSKRLPLNEATAGELTEVYGIGNKLSVRIVSYRNRLGGYTYLSQLDEVYGLKGEALVNLKKRYKIYERPVLNKVSVNTASFKEVLSIVYLDYETTKLIFQYKDSVGQIEDLKEIKKIPGFPIDKYDRIALYLQAE